MRVLYRPGLTIGPTNIVAIWFLLESSSSSQVKIRRLLFDCAHRTYESNFSLSHLSPCAIASRGVGPSCMSLSWFGMTKETVGSLEYSDGNTVNGRFISCGKPLPCQLTMGLCFRA